jgi:hypothetical protein
MNFKRLPLTILVLFVGVFATDFLIHAVWLKPDYVASASLWRAEADSMNYFPLLMLGQLLAVVTFAVLWALGFAARRCLKSACLFGLLMGLFSQATTLITYAVQPLPPGIAVKWFLAGLGQGVLMGVLAFFVYKPKPETSGSSARPA